MAFGDTEAAEVITRAGLRVGTVTSRSSLALPAGIVLSESPARGTRVAVHSPVEPAREFRRECSQAERLAEEFKAERRTHLFVREL